MIQAAMLGNLAIVIGGDVSGLDKAAAKAEGIVGRLTGGVNSQAAAMAKYAAVATAAGVALAVGLLAKSMETIDAQSKLAARLNGTTAELQALVHAGDLAGVSQEQLATSVGKMNQKLAEAARTGQGPAYEALQRLGLSAKDFLALPVNERLATLADKFKGLGYNTAQQADALKQMGVRGQELLSLFEGGGDGIRDATKDVEAFGVAVSDIDGASVEAANDAWTTARLLLTGIGNQLAVTLAPLIKDIGDRFADAGRESHGFSEAIQSGVLIAVMTFAKLQREIYQTRLDMDNAAADMAANWNAFVRMARNVAPKLSGDFGLTQIEHNFGNLKHTLAEPPSDEEWAKWWEEIRRKAREAAEKVVEERKKVNQGSGDTGDGLTDQERKAQQDKLDRLKKSIATEDEQLRMQRDEQLADLKEFEDKKIATTAEANSLRLQIQDKYQKDLQQLIQSKFENQFATEDEALAAKYAKQLADLDEFEKGKTQTAEYYAALRKKIDEKYEKDSMKLHAQQYSALAGIVDTSMGQITSLVDSEGNKQFGIFKAIASATALVKGYEAAVSAYAAGNATGVPGLGAIMAGISAAGTAAYIAKLNSVSVGGAGGGGAAAPAAGGGGAAVAAATPAASAAPQQTMFVTLQGDYFSREFVRDFTRKQIDFQRDGGRVVLT